MIDANVLHVHGPIGGAAAASPIVLDSPHSGHRFPADFDAAVSEFDLRDGEDCFVDELYAPAVERGIPLLAAEFPRTYLDPNRHRGGKADGHRFSRCIRGDAQVDRVMLCLEGSAPTLDRKSTRLNSSHRP